MPKTGRGICRSNTLPSCSAHMNMSSKCSVSSPQLASGLQTLCDAARDTLHHRDLLSHQSLVCKTSHESSLLLSSSSWLYFSSVFVSVRHPRALPGMMQWIRSQRPGESGINIITADFVELGEFISAVITLNYHLDDDDDDATWEPAEGVREHSRQRCCQQLGLCSHSFLFGICFKRGAALLLSLYLGL